MALYHSARGSVDYTIVGNPTIVDGVVSGFSGNDYLRLNSRFNPQGTWECVVKIRIPEQFSGDHYLIGDVYGAGNPRSFVLGLNKYRDLKFWVSGNGTSWDIANGIIASGSLSLGTDYFVRCGFTGSNYFVDYSTDGINYVGRAEIQSDTIVSSNLISIGRAYGSNFFWSGSIDLNHTYIKVNDQPWFGICPVEVKKHQLMGPVGYTVVGSPTITDGVVSNFSNNNYVAVPAFSPANNTWQIATKIKLTDTTTNQVIFSNNYQPNRQIQLSVQNSKLKVYISTNGTSPNLANGVFGTATILADTVYWVKFEFTRNAYIVSYSLNGISWTPDIIINSTATLVSVSNNLFFGRNTHPDFPDPLTDGSIIYLNGTYIKVNGKLWFWQPQATKYIQRNNQLVFADPKLYLSGPVNYELVGSPTIVDGVVSGFSSSDYLQTSNALSSSSNNIFIKIRFKTPSTVVASGSTNICFFGSILRNNNCIRLYRATSYGIYLVAFGWDLFAGRNLIEENAWYTVDFSSIDGISTVTLYDKNGATLASSSSSWLQVNIDSVGYFGGKYSQNIDSIDLNETYIKVNDQLWFYGKNYATQNIAPVPSGYTFGTTTTSSIGYVDMRTQTFYSAPQGAIIGRDE